MAGFIREFCVRPFLLPCVLLLLLSRGCTRMKERP